MLVARPPVRWAAAGSQGRILGEPHRLATEEDLANAVLPWTNHAASIKRSTTTNCNDMNTLFKKESSNVEEAGKASLLPAIFMPALALRSLARSCT